jgi:uncharacterized oligopeptide transporter (OPT) family protein
VEILAVVLLSFFLVAPILALHEANLDTGGIGGRALPAPQAGLMAQLALGMMSGQMAWGLLGIGAAFGAGMIMCGSRAPMLIAVGMYLPFDTTSSILLGGVMQWIALQWGADEERGTLLASGLIAGEAIVGILLAVTFIAGIPSFTKLLFGVDGFAWYPAYGGWLSIVAFMAVGWVLIQMAKKKQVKA